MESTTVFATLARFFRGQPWSYREEPDRNLISFEYGGQAGAWRTYATAFEEAQQVAVYGVVPFAVAPAQRGVAAELVHRINFGLVIGNFEIDLGDGEIRYKTSLDFDGGRLTEPLLLQLVRSNLSVMEHYLPALVAVATRDASALDALASVDTAG